MIEFEQYPKKFIRISTRLRYERDLDLTYICKMTKYSKEQSINNAVFLYRYYRVGAVSVVCNITKKCWVGLFGVEKIMDKNFGTNVFTSCEPGLRNDYVLYGLSDFTVTVHCLFSSYNEAMNYRDFLINRLLDMGYSYYGLDIANGVVPRFLIIRLNIDVVDNLFEFCRKRGRTVNNVLSALIKKII